MNEEAIKAKLAEHLKTNNVVPEDPGRIQEEEVTDTSTNNLPLDNMILRQETFDLLNVPVFQRSSTDRQNEIESIIRWASSEVGNEKADILKAIQEHINAMGWQTREDKISRLYRFVKLSNQRRVIDTQMGALRG